MGARITSFRPSGVVSDSTDVATATNAAAAITYGAAGAGARHAISGLCWSYSGPPTGGGLIVTDGGTTVFTIDITSAGAGFIPFDPFKLFAVNTDVVVTLAAGGSGVVGKVSVPCHWTE
jgi:hypothetical protein